MLTKRVIILAVLTMLNLSLMSASADSKCGNVFITIKGKIIGSQNNTFRIAVQIVPEPNSSLQPEFPIKDGYFEGSVLFDTTKSGGAKGHNCTRTPEKVHVELLKERTEIDSLWLIVTEDFIKNKAGDYAVPSPIELHSKDDPID